MGVAIKVNKNAGSKVYFDGVESGSSIINLSSMRLPIKFNTRCAVVYNNEIHIFTPSSHYKWNGVTWTPASTFSMTSTDCAVVYHDEIHVFGNSAHRKWDGTEWTIMPTVIGSDMTGSCAVVYDDKIHIIGSSTEAYSKYHFIWDGETWVKNTMSYSTSYSAVTVYDNAIHLIGTYNSTTYHYVYDGSSWSSSVKPSGLRSGSTAVTFDDKLYLFGGGGTYYNSDCYTWDGTEWTKQENLTYCTQSGIAVVYRGEIYCFCGSYGNYGMQVYKKAAYSVME